MNEQRHVFVNAGASNTQVNEQTKIDESEAAFNLTEGKLNMEEM